MRPRAGRRSCGGGASCRRSRDGRGRSGRSRRRRSPRAAAPPCPPAPPPPAGEVHGRAGHARPAPTRPGAQALHARPGDVRGPPHDQRAGGRRPVAGQAGVERQAHLAGRARQQDHAGGRAGGPLGAVSGDRLAVGLDGRRGVDPRDEDADEGGRDQHRGRAQQVGARPAPGATPSSAPVTRIAPSVPQAGAPPLQSVRIQTVGRAGVGGGPGLAAQVRRPICRCSPGTGAPTLPGLVQGAAATTSARMLPGTPQGPGAAPRSGPCASPGCRTGGGSARSSPRPPPRGKSRDH